MSKYRVYEFLDDGRITEPPAEFECETDDKAIKRARRSLGNRTIEVWTLQRFVARIEPRKS